MLIYIAGPYEGVLYATPLLCAGIDAGKRIAIVEGNVQAALLIANTVIQLGCVPFVPHLWHEMNKQFKHNRQTWLNLGLRALQYCHAVIRLPGISEGADQEVAQAVALGIPVFDSDNLLAFAEFVRKRKGESFEARLCTAAERERAIEEERFKRFVRNNLPPSKEAHSE